MDVLGLTYASPDLPDLIARRSGGRANLIAIVCAETLAALPPGERVIGRDVVEKSLAGQPSREALAG